MGDEKMENYNLTTEQEEKIVDNVIGNIDVLSFDSWYKIHVAANDKYKGFLLKYVYKVLSKETAAPGELEAAARIACSLLSNL